MDEYVIVLSWVVPPVHGDNPQALASGLSYVQVDNYSITLYTNYISLDLARHEIFCAKVGKGGKVLWPIKST